MKQQDVRIGRYYHETMTGLIIFVSGKAGQRFISYVRHEIEDHKSVEKAGTIQARFLVPLYALPEPPTEVG